MKSVNISEKLRYDKKPVLKIAEGVTVEVNNKAIDLLEAAELADGDITKAAIDRLLTLLYSEEDKEKLLSLDLSIHDFMTVITESISAVVGGGKN